VRRIELKRVEADDESDFDYREVLIDILRVNQQGMDLAEMETALTCIGKIKRAPKQEGEGSFVDLEDAEHQYVDRRVSAHRWRVADSAIVNFVKAVRDAKPPLEDQVAAE